MQTSAAHVQPLRARLLEELNPKASVRAALKEDLPKAESTDLIQFAPEFPQAMYEPLRDYFEDALLPGLEQVLPNTITLLETNPRFIEAYMAGLNHEMSRELVWRGFPTDQRGTCFRQFWDIRGRVPRPTPEERRWFSLVYMKTYPLQGVQGRRFGMGQSHAHPWLHALWVVRRATWRTLGDAPTRSVTALAQRLGMAEADAAAMVEPTEGVPPPDLPPAAPIRMKLRK